MKEMLEAALRWQWLMFELSFPLGFLLILGSAAAEVQAEVGQGRQRQVVGPSSSSVPRPMRTLLVALAVLPACGGSPAAGPPPSSGWARGEAPLEDPWAGPPARDSSAWRDGGEAAGSAEGPFPERVAGLPFGADVIALRGACGGRFASHGDVAMCAGAPGAPFGATEVTALLCSGSSCELSLTGLSEGPEGLRRALRSIHGPPLVRRSEEARSMLWGWSDGSLLVVLDAPDFPGSGARRLRVIWATSDAVSARIGPRLARSAP